MLSKETFVRTIDSIKEHRERENKFLEGLDAVSPDTHNDTFLYSDYEALVVDLLQEAMSDKNETIAWWIYDAEFGSDDKINLFDADKKTVDLSDASKLYDYLKKS